MRAALQAFYSLFFLCGTISTAIAQKTAQANVGEAIEFLSRSEDCSHAGDFKDKGLGFPLSEFKYIERSSLRVSPDGILSIETIRESTVFYDYTKRKFLLGSSSVKETYKIPLSNVFLDIKQAEQGDNLKLVCSKGECVQSKSTTKNCSVESEACDEKTYDHAVKHVDAQGCRHKGVGLAIKDLITNFGGGRRTKYD